MFSCNTNHKLQVFDSIGINHFHADTIEQVPYYYFVKIYQDSFFFELL